MRWPTGPHIDHPQGDGGNSATLPEESAKYAVNHRAGKAGRPAHLWSTPCASFRARIAGATGARPSLRPCPDKGDATKQSSGEMSRESEKVCPLFEKSIEVIRAPDAAQRPFDGALQSRGPSSEPSLNMGPGSAPQREGRCSASRTQASRIVRATESSSSPH